MAVKIASQADIEAYKQAPSDCRNMSPALRGVLQEAALTGILRYPWSLVKVLLLDVMQAVLQEFENQAREAGPSPAGYDSASCQYMREQLLNQLQGWTRGAPFTLQRLCEVVLEPRPQYNRFDKLAQALEKLLRVTSTIDKTCNPPSRPDITDLGPVNANPAPPALQDSAAHVSYVPAGNKLANGQPDGSSGHLFMTTASSGPLPAEEGAFIESEASQTARTTPAMDDHLVRSPASPPYQGHGPGPDTIGLEDVGFQRDSSPAHPGVQAVTSIPASPPRPEEQGSPTQPATPPDHARQPCSPPPEDQRPESLSRALLDQNSPLQPMIGPQLPPAVNGQMASQDVHMADADEEGDVRFGDNSGNGGGQGLDMSD